MPRESRRTGVTRIKGPGVVSARPSPSSISAGHQPAICLDRLLRHIGEDSVGAAEGDDRHLGEEQPLCEEHAVGAAENADHRDRREPRREKDGDECDGAAQRRRGLCGLFGLAVILDAQAGAARFVPRGSLQPLPPMTMAGNGTPKKKISTKASAAISGRTGPPRMRFDMRISASTTMTSTAALIPKKSAETNAVCP